MLGCCSFLYVYLDPAAFQLSEQLVDALVGGVSGNRKINKNVSVAVQSISFSAILRSDVMFCTGVYKVVQHEQKLRKSSNSNFCGLSPISTRALAMSWLLHQDDFAWF